MKKRGMALFVVLVLCISLLSGCGSSGVMNSSDSSSSDSTTSNGQTYEWRLASAWGEGSRQFEFDQRFCERVSEMSGGRLTIKCYGAGQLCSTTEVFDLVANGDVEVGSDAPQYWSGKNTAFDSLDDELKNIVETCAKANLLEAYGENMMQDADATNKMVSEEGVTISYFSEDDLAQIETARNQVYEEMSAENADFATIAQSQMNYFKTMTYYQESFLGDYSTTRIPEEFPNI